LKCTFIYIAKWWALYFDFIYLSLYKIISLTHMWSSLLNIKNIQYGIIPITQLKNIFHLKLLHVKIIIKVFYRVYGTNIVKSATYMGSSYTKSQMHRYASVFFFNLSSLGTGSWRRKLKIALFGELSLEEAIDLSGDRQILDWV
jgi:hypothetical protein